MLSSPAQKSPPHFPSRPSGVQVSEAAQCTETLYVLLQLNNTCQPHSSPTSHRAPLHTIMSQIMSLYPQQVTHILLLLLGVEIYTSCTHFTKVHSCSSLPVQLSFTTKAASELSPDMLRHNSDCTRFYSTRLFKYLRLSQPNTSYLLLVVFIIIIDTSKHLIQSSQIID